MATAVVFRALSIGANPWDLGHLGLSATLVSLVSSLPLGHIVDRLPRRQSILISHAVLALLAFSLSYLSSPGYLALNIIVGLIAVSRNFRSISQFTVFGELLRGNDRIPHWVNLSTLSWQVAAFAAPIIAGLVCQCWSNIGVRSCFIISGVLFLSAFLCQTKVVPNLTTAHAGNLGKVSIEETFTFFSRNESLLSALALDFVVVLFSGASAVIPFLQPGFRAPLALGLLRSALPCGVIAGTILVLRRPIMGRELIWLLGGTTGFAVAHFLLAGSSFFALSYTLLMAAGFCDAISLSVREVLLQQKTPLAIKGRIYAINNFLVNASDEISEWESGVAAHAVGVKASLRFGSVVTLLASGYFGLRVARPHSHKGKEHANVLTISCSTN